MRGVEEREKWHVGREVPLAVISTLCVMILAQIGTWQAFKNEVENYMEFQQDQRIEDIKTMRAYVEARTDDRIRGSQVHSMLEVRDVKHEALVKQVDRMSSEITRLARTVNDAIRNSSQQED